MTQTRTYTRKPDPTEAGIYLVWKAGESREQTPGGRTAKWCAINRKARDEVIPAHWRTASTDGRFDDDRMPANYVGDWEGPLVLNDRLHPNDRIALATRTEAPVTPEMIARFSNPETIRILHAVIGLCTESGELLDQLKKHLFYGKPLDKLNLMEEMGDQDWYLSLMCNVLGTTMALIEVANIRKLAARYGEKFSQDAALVRNLGIELKVLQENLPHNQAEPNEVCFPK